MWQPWAVEAGDDNDVMGLYRIGCYVYEKVWPKDKRTGGAVTDRMEGKRGRGRGEGRRDQMEREEATRKRTAQKLRP